MCKHEAFFEPKLHFRWFRCCMLHCHVVIVSAIETTAITSNEIRMNAPLTLSEVETCVCAIPEQCRW